jgi:ERCC4-type nuclease
MKLDWILIQDTREKKPLLFPKTLSMWDPATPAEKPRTARINLHIVKEKLDTADYALQGHENNTLIERKGSLREITKNCFHYKDRQRFLDCVKRLRDSCDNPILLLEGSPALMLKPTKEVTKPYFSVDSLLRILMEYKIGFWFIPSSTIAQRRSAGEWTARALINGVL